MQELPLLAKYVLTSNNSFEPISSRYRITFQIEGETSSVNFNVMQSCSKMILGLDWLEFADAHYHFRARTLEVNGKYHRLRAAPYRSFRVHTALCYALPARSISAVTVVLQGKRYIDLILIIP